MTPSGWSIGYASRGENALCGTNRMLCITPDKENILCVRPIDCEVLRICFACDGRA
jgi:hypothetical protein